MIKKPDWWLLGETLALLLSFLVMGEIAFRQSAIQNHFLGPQIGSRHGQFDQQWARLEKLEASGEPIDCILLGNSMIWIDANPFVVADVFQSVTGQKIDCFNFGVSALPASSAGLLASVLVEKFHPKILVYGTAARDYAIPDMSEDAVVISDTPWLRYQNGSFSPEGWLYANSKFYQYKNYLPKLILLGFEDVIPGYSDLPAYHDFGYDPKIGQRIDVSRPLDMEDIGSREARKWLYHYNILDENLDGLRGVVQQSSQGVQVIVIEMPFHPSAYEFFSNGQSDYNQFVQHVTQITTEGKVSFWRLQDQPQISDPNWWDFFHMNFQGAEIFSRWLGQELGEATIEYSQK